MDFSKNIIEKDKEEVVFVPDLVVSNVRKCSYFNRGHCKYKTRCRYSHPRNICKVYLENKKYEKDKCRDRHPKLCKFWLKGRSGCKRDSSCDFLHATLDIYKTK